MLRRSTVAIVALLVSTSTACKDEPGSLELAHNEKQAAAKPASNVTVITTPVPYGTKLACEKLFDVAKLGAALGKEVTLTDASGSEMDATSVCQIKLAGVPPTAEEQKKKWVDNNRVLGVLPGDEICTVTLSCGFIYDIAEQKRKCESDGQKVSTEVGELTCVKIYEAAADYRYVFSVFDPDTKCKMQVNPGPSVVDEATPKACAKAAVDLITSESIKTP